MTASVKLYDIANARGILDEFLAETEGEVTPELQQLLDELAGEAAEKIERVALYIREQAATAKAIQEEADRLQTRAAAKLKAADGLKAYLKLQLERLGTTKVDGLLCSVALQNSPLSLRGDFDDSKLRELYELGIPYVRRVPESFKLDRKAALDAAKANVPLVHGLAVEQTTHVRIR
jgi:Siphovirus Gp157